MEPKPILCNCTHFRHPTDEQLGLVDIFFSNYYNLQSVYFEFPPWWGSGYFLELQLTRIWIIKARKQTKFWIKQGWILVQPEEGFYIIVTLIVIPTPNLIPNPFPNLFLSDPFSLIPLFSISYQGLQLHLIIKVLYFCITDGITKTYQFILSSHTKNTLKNVHSW